MIIYLFFGGRKAKDSDRTNINKSQSTLFILFQSRQIVVKKN